MIDTRDGVQRKLCWQLGVSYALTQGVVRALSLTWIVVGLYVLVDVGMSSAGCVFRVTTLVSATQMMVLG